MSLAQTCLLSGRKLTEIQFLSYDFERFEDANRITNFFMRTFKFLKNQCFAQCWLITLLFSFSFIKFKFLFLVRMLYEYGGTKIMRVMIIMTTIKNKNKLL